MDNKFWQKLLDAGINVAAGVTKPFAMGANILAQGYGDLYRGLSGNTDYVSPLEEYIKSGISQEEMGRINKNPYKEILKSGAGMASRLMPLAKAGTFTQAGVDTGRYLSNFKPTANTLFNKDLQTVLRGALEGGAAGYGGSEDGKEVSDTVRGIIGGVIGEGVGTRLFDKSYKELINNPRMADFDTMVNNSLRNTDRMARELGDNISTGSSKLTGVGSELSKDFDNYIRATNLIDNIDSVKGATLRGGSENLRGATLDILDFLGEADYPKEIKNAVKRLSGVKGGEKQIFELVRNYAIKSLSNR